MKVFIALHIFLLSLSVSCAEHLPPIKPPKKHAKHKTKQPAFRISPDGVQECLIRPEGQRAVYWLDEETIKQLAALEAVKKTWRKANKLGLSYDDYVLLREHRLLRGQQKKRRKNCLV